METDCLPTLVNMMELANQLTSSQLSTILNDFMSAFNVQILMKMIFNGFHASNNNNKIKWISFFIDKMQNNFSILLPNNKKSQNLTDLSIDTLTSVCQYLQFDELVKLEQCNRFLFTTIRNNPQCIITLNDISLKTYYKSTTTLSKIISRFLNVRTLSWSPCISNDKYITTLMNNQIHKLILHKGTFQFNDLNFLKYTNISSLEITNLFTNCITIIKHIPNLITLDFRFIKPPSKPGFVTEFIDLLLQMSKLQTLKISTAVHSNVPSDINLFHSNTSIKTLKEFRFHNNIQNINPQWTLFVQNILNNCKHLHTLQLYNIWDIFNDRNHIIDNIHFGNIQQLKLDLITPKLGELLLYLTQSKTRLTTISLVLWNKHLLEHWDKYGTEFFNCLKQLLEYQLITCKHSLLRSIVFKMECLDVGNYNLDFNPFRMLLLVLINIFDRKTTKHHALSITFECINKCNAPPISYICYKCDNGGHWAKDCYSNRNPFEFTNCDQLTPSSLQPLIIQHLLNSMYKKITYCAVVFKQILNINYYNIRVNDKWLLLLNCRDGTYKIINFMLPNNEYSISHTLPASINYDINDDNGSWEQHRFAFARYIDEFEEFKDSNSYQIIEYDNKATYSLNALSYIELSKNEFPFDFAHLITNNFSIAEKQCNIKMMKFAQQINLSTITISVQSTNNRIYFMVKETTRFRKLMIAYYQRMNIEVPLNLYGAFAFKGTIIHPESVPFDYSMRENDIIYFS